MSKGKKIGIAVVVVAAIVLLGGLAAANAGERGKLVRTEEVVRRDLISTVTASGKIEPKRKVEISADISGRVIEVAVEEGQYVERGDLLLRIDPTAYQAALRRAEASVAQAQAQASQARANVLQSQNALRRAQQLAAGQDLISAADVEQAETNAAVAEAQHESARFAVRQAQASVIEARDALAKTTIVAPMSGRVTRLNIEEGETAIVGTMNNPGTVLLTVADLSVMEATVEVDETDVPSISFGDSTVVRIDAFPGQEFTGRVTRIANSAIQNAGAVAAAGGQSVDFEVVITLDSPPSELRPDLSATAEIVTDVRREVLAVPIIALTVRDAEGKKRRLLPGEEEQEAAGSRRAEEVEGVFVLENGKAAFRPVEVGITGDRYFEVLTGLEGGETVVSGTYQDIRDLEAGNVIRSLRPAPASPPSGGDEPGGDDAEEGE